MTSFKPSTEHCIYSKQCNKIKKNYKAMDEKHKIIIMSKWYG